MKLENNNALKKEILVDNQVERLGEPINLESDYLNQYELDMQVAVLDPLGADHFMVDMLPLVSSNKLILVSNAINFAKISSTISEPDQTTALAVLRDLGMLAAALRRNNVDVHTLPILNDELARMALFASEVPRDTVFSYGPRNPEGPRMRMFTTRTEESIFIQSFREGMKYLGEVISNLHSASKLDFNSLDFPIHINKASEKLQGMIHAIHVVRKEIPPAVFTGDLRPFFDPINVNGKKYLAPGGAGMPFILIDKLLWSSDFSDPTYIAYYEENLTYLPHSYRNFAEQIDSIESMVPKFFNQLKTDPISKEMMHSAEALQGIFKTLLHFRAPHKRVADDNFKLRSKDDVGSGGFKPDLLQMLIDRVFEVNKRLLEFIEDNKGLKSEYVPYEVGTVFNKIEGEYSPEALFQSVTLDYPSRLNAMAIDPSKIVSNNNMVFTPGEVVFAINIPKRIEVTRIEGCEIVISADSKRKSLIKHAVILTRKALGVNHGLHISVGNQKELKHCGLGSSSGLISGVAAAINELYGNPIPNDVMIKYLAQNHGEEIENSDSHLMPVQCIGGSAAAGFSNGSVLILAGESQVVSKVEVDQNYKVIIGIPRDFNPRDAKELMELEVKALPKFLETGTKYGPQIAYDMFHKVLPSLMKGSLKELGDLIYSYRFNMGSIQNCSFVYPEMVNIADRLKFLKEEGSADILSLSSVGPAFFAITKTPDVCRNAFQENNLEIHETTLCNKGYSVIEKL